MVNIWIEMFKKALKSKFDQFEFKSTAFTAIVTYDIDVAYKYKGRSFGRTLGSALKDLLALMCKILKKEFKRFCNQKKIHGMFTMSYRN